MPVDAINYAVGGIRNAGIFEVYASAYCTADNTASTFCYRVAVKRGGGAAALVGVADDLGSQTEAGCSLAISCSSGNVIVTITGEPAKTLTWRVALYKKVGFT